MCNLNPTLYIYIYREREREREREDVVWCSFVGFSYHKTAHRGAVRLLHFAGSFGRSNCGFMI